MAFKDLAAFNEDPIVLPIRGRDFAFPGSVSARIGLTLQRARLIAAKASEGKLDPATEAISDDEQEAVNAAMLGGTRDDLLDYATAAEYAAVMRCLFNAHVFGREFAEKLWNALGEAPAPSPSERPKARGSRAGSTTRQGRKAASSRGRKSSTAGDS